MAERRTSSDFRARRDVFPIFVIGRSSILTAASFRGTGFLIAPNILVTCWHCVCQALEVGQRYAVLADEGDGYATYPLLSVEQHPRGLDLAMANINLVPRYGFTLSEDELSPGDEVATYEYHFADRVPAAGEDVRSQITARFLRGYVTRSFSYDCPGFTHTPSYELCMPVLHEMHGSPLIKPGTKEVAGVIFGSLQMPRAEQFSSGGLKVEAEQLTPVQPMTFSLAHETSSLWSLRGSATHGMPLKEVIFKNRRIRPGSTSSPTGRRSTGEPITEKVSTEKMPAATSSPRSPGRGIRISRELTTLYRQAIRPRRPPTSADRRERLEAEMEKLRHKLERYEAQLSHEQLKGLREQRRIVRELCSMYPSGDFDLSSTSCP